MNQTLRFPAEWEAQSGVLIAWPTADTDWADRLGQVEDLHRLVAAITRFQPVLICVADDDVETYAEMRLRSNRIDMDKVHFTTAAYDDTWLRDSGPITLRRADGGFQLLDFRFTGWGGKFDATLDDQLVGVLDQAGVFNDAPVRSIPFALEGGGIETDGEGTLLTTWKCLHERHPDRDRASLSADLADWLQQDRVLWLDHGYLEGDDTDAHIDTLARFASADSIVYQACDDESDSHYAELRAMGNSLAALRTGRPAVSPVPAAVGAAGDRRRPPSCCVVRQLPDRQRRGADAGLWRPGRRPGP